MESFSDTNDVVVDQRPDEAVQGTRLTLVIGTSHRDGVVLDGDLNGVGNGELKLAFRSLHGDHTILLGHSDPAGDSDGIF